MIKDIIRKLLCIHMYSYFTKGGIAYRYCYKCSNYENAKRFK